MFAKFAENNETITNWFSGPQAPEQWPGVVEIEADDPRYAAYVASLPVGARVGLPTPA